MRSYSLLAIQTCHRRGIHAIGGMAAQIPIKNDPQANEEAMEKVRADKVREAGDGHDGTWVAHPGLVAVAKEAFDARMPEPNQIGRRRDDVQVTARDLLTVPRARSPSAGCARTSTLASNTWRPGWGATAACRFIISWRTPPRPKSPAPDSGNGCIRPKASCPTAAR